MKSRQPRLFVIQKIPGKFAIDKNNDTDERGLCQIEPLWSGKEMQDQRVEGMDASFYPLSI
ncbi:hypothetical protein [Reticulibacter mediterranei]|uniref:hypothetical protein n=1 Tax=Reticulibacter mediterranei TaxID=2778369 RepID=UPI001C689B6C|nr:hypothetical protein [Reticulibacter mediterranei]